MKTKKITLTTLLIAFMFYTGVEMKNNNQKKSPISKNTLTQIASNLVTSYDLCTPQGILDAIRELSKKFNHSLNPQIIRNILHTAGADIYATDSDGRTILHLATLKNDIYITHFILHTIQNPEQKTIFVNLTINNPKNWTHNWTALHEATRSGNNEIVKGLIAAGAEVDKTINNPGYENHGCTSLHKAAMYNHVSVLSSLITAGADINKTINNPGTWYHGMTALCLAIAFNHTDAIQTLITAGAQVPVDLLSPLQKLGIK